MWILPEAIREELMETLLYWTAIGEFNVEQFIKWACITNKKFENSTQLQCENRHSWLQLTQNMNYPVALYHDQFEIEPFVSLWSSILTHIYYIMNGVAFVACLMALVFLSVILIIKLMDCIPKMMLFDYLQIMQQSSFKFNKNESLKLLFIKNISNVFYTFSSYKSQQRSKFECDIIIYLIQQIIYQNSNNIKYEAMYQLILITHNLDKKMSFGTMPISLQKCKGVIIFLLNRLLICRKINYWTFRGKLIKYKIYDEISNYIDLCHDEWTLEQISWFYYSFTWYPQQILENKELTKQIIMDLTLLSMYENDKIISRVFAGFARLTQGLTRIANTWSLNVILPPHTKEQDDQFKILEKKYSLKVKQRKQEFDELLYNKFNVNEKYTKIDGINLLIFKYFNEYQIKYIDIISRSIECLTNKHYGWKARAHAAIPLIDITSNMSYNSYGTICVLKEQFNILPKLYNSLLLKHNALNYGNIFMIIDDIAFVKMEDVWNYPNLIELMIKRWKQEINRNCKNALRMSFRWRWIDYFDDEKWKIMICKYEWLKLLFLLLNNICECNMVQWHKNRSFMSGLSPILSIIQQILLMINVKPFIKNELIKCDAMETLKKIKEKVEIRNKETKYKFGYYYTQLPNVINQVIQNMNEQQIY